MKIIKNTKLKSKIKIFIPQSIISSVNRLNRQLRWKGKSRIFCISMQKSGTTSVSDFFKINGFPTCSNNKRLTRYWTKCWYDGDIESIFKSKEFLSYQVFEDNPWWSPGFYKILYHRFPKAKFVLMYRDSNDWFKSMLSHSDGKTLGNTKRHCKIYRRETEFYNNFDFNKGFKTKELDVDNLMKLKGFDDQYKDLYELHNREVIDFFESNNSDALFCCNLYDKNKWHELGKFLGIDVPMDFDVHSNQSEKLFKK